tara:strand:+ start:749 stop:1204 length:456 start_codon:yes stop_codon:yes gene_type:complete
MIPMANKGNFWINCKDGITVLYERSLAWMDNSPQEQTTHDFIVDAVKGKVLVGGLGLGCVVERLQAKREVTKIIVIEIAQDVIDLVWRYLDVPKAEIICDDLKHYLENTDEQFDYICMDVWPEKGHKTILYWRKLAEQKVKPENVLCWGEL